MAASSRLMEFNQSIRRFGFKPDVSG